MTMVGASNHHSAQLRIRRRLLKQIHLVTASAIITYCVAFIFLNYPNLSAEIKGRDKIAEYGIHFDQPHYSCTIHGVEHIFPTVPDIIVAGAQKSGTSSLLALLAAHPNIRNSKRFEQHFFDHHFPGIVKKASNSSDENERYCVALEEYQHQMGLTSLVDMNSTQSRPLIVEKTPSYLLYPHIPHAIIETCPWKPKIIVILRNPVERLLSHFRMDMMRRKNIPVDKFESMLNKNLSDEIQVMRFLGLSTSPTPEEQMAESTSTKWDIPNITLQERDERESMWNPLYYKDQNEKTRPEALRRYLQRGMYATQLERWKLRFQMLVLWFDELHESPEEVAIKLYDFVGVTRKLPSLSILERKWIPRSMLQNQNKAIREWMPSNNTLTFLKDFYKPYNKRLADLLDVNWPLQWNMM